METFNTSFYQSSDLSIWGNGNIKLIISSGGFYSPESSQLGPMIWLKRECKFSILSKMHAVLGLYFDTFSASIGTLLVSLGEQVLLDQKIGQQTAQSRIYFAISPGDNVLSLNFYGERHYEIFDPLSEGKRLLDFAIIKPEVKVISC